MKKTISFADEKKSITVTRTVIQWTLFIVLGLWLLTAFLILCGEETEQMSLLKLMAIKAIALAGMYGGICAGKVFHRMGMLPPFIDEIKEED